MLFIYAFIWATILDEGKGRSSQKNEACRKCLHNTHWNFLSLHFSLGIFTWQSLFYWNLYLLFLDFSFEIFTYLLFKSFWICFALTCVLKSLHSLYCLLKSLLSLYFSIETFTFYFLCAFLLNPLLSLCFSIEISATFYFSIEISSFSLLSFEISTFRSTARVRIYCENAAIQTVACVQTSTPAPQSWPIDCATCAPAPHLQPHYIAKNNHAHNCVGTAPEPRRNERLKPLAFTTVRTSVCCENAAIRTVPYVQPSTLSHARHTNCDLLTELSYSIVTVTKPFKCELPFDCSTTWLSYSIVSYLSVALPLDWAVQLWATSGLLYYLAELFNCELPLDCSTSWLSFWILSYLLVALTLDWAFQFWTTFWLLYHLTELFKCELPVSCSTTWLSYSIVSYLWIILPLGWAIQLWFTSKLLYYLTELFNCEVPLDCLTSWLSFWILSYLLVALTLD